MALFKKEQKAKPTPVIEYSQPEQGVPRPAPVNEPSPVEAALSQILRNQGTIVENQQMILNAIGGTQALIRRLAGAEEEAQEEEEVQEEEEEEVPPPPKKKTPIVQIKKGK